METFEASTDSWNTAHKAEHKPCLMSSLGFSIKEAYLPLSDSIKTLHVKTLVCKAKDTYSHLGKCFLKANTPCERSWCYCGWWFICLIEEKLLRAVQRNTYIFTDENCHPLGALGFRFES